MHERDVLTDCLRYLGTYPDVLAWRNNTGAIPDAKGRVVRFGLVGSSDIIAVRSGGRVVFVECKAARGRLSTQQERFRDRVVSLGAAYIVARSVADLYSEFPQHARP